MVDRVATYLVEVYGADEAVEFAIRAVAESRAHNQPASAAEWERVVAVLKDPERVAEILRDLERGADPPEHAAWCIAKDRVLLALASALTVDLPL
jgi:hypothetical protein